jgi:putative SOS response-associated peptidase YedK
MCGRFGRFGGEEPEAFAAWFEALAYMKVGWKKDLYNCAPTQSLPIVLMQEGERRMVPARWGWQRDFSEATLVNARGEEAVRKKTWSEALFSRRCLVPATCFYEWRPHDRQPFAFFLNPRVPFGIGGLWEVDPSHGLAFILLTTPANELVSPIHDRMPCIVPPADYRSWLEPATPATEVISLIKPFPAAAMEAHPVSKLVSSVKNDGPGLIERVQVGEQQRLF